MIAVSGIQAFGSGKKNTRQAGETLSTGGAPSSATSSRLTGP